MSNKRENDDGVLLLLGIKNGKKAKVEPSPGTVFPSMNLPPMVGPIASPAAETIASPVAETVASITAQATTPIVVPKHNFVVPTIGVAACASAPVPKHNLVVPSLGQFKIPTIGVTACATAPVPEHDLDVPSLGQKVIATSVAATPSSEKKQMFTCSLGIVTIKKGPNESMVIPPDFVSKFKKEIIKFIPNNPVPIIASAMMVRITFEDYQIICIVPKISDQKKKNEFMNFLMSAFVKALQ